MDDAPTRAAGIILFVVTPIAYPVLVVAVFLSTWVLQKAPLDINKQNVYNQSVLRSFASSETERFFATGKSRSLPRDILKRAAMRLTQLDGAVRLDDLRNPPSNRLEALAHDRAGQWSIRINDQWRICFRFENGDVYDVEIVDYH